MKKILCFLSVLFISFSSVTAFASGIYKVVKITDGDTFQATDGVIHFKVRMIGMDAPESYQELGKLAKYQLEKLILDKDIRLEPIGHSGLDKYGRVLAKVYESNQDVSLKMIENGYAFYYRPYCTDYPDHKKSYQYDPMPYVEAEQKAKSQKLGIWTTHLELPCLARKHHKK